VLEDKEQMISDALDVFLAGFDRVFGAAAAPARTPTPAFSSEVDTGSR
jgi:hypothetical protein